MISSKEIQSFICKHWLVKHFCPYVCSNIKIHGWEMDVLAITEAGIVNEFEVKVSRADFFADFKKETKHQFFQGMATGDLSYLKATIPNKFYYAVPKNLVSVNEVPDYAGLIYFTKYKLKDFPGKEFIEFEYAKKAPYIHKNKAPNEMILKICRALSSRMVLGCALLTYNNRKAKGIHD